jgi:hypothetical protein
MTHEAVLDSRSDVGIIAPAVTEFSRLADASARYRRILLSAFSP